MQILCESKANVNARGTHSWTPLMIAVQKGHIEIAQNLLDFGAEINTKEKNYAPLHLAVFLENLNLVKMLLENGANVNFLVMNNSSALEIAAFENKSEHIAKFLLDSGAEINHCNDKQETALHFSVNRGHFVISKLLIENQAKVNAQEQNGLTPLHIATRVNSIPLIELLLNHGSDPNVQDRELNNCLHHAILRKNVEIAKILLNHEADFEVPNSQNKSAKDLAIEANFKVLVQMMDEKTKYKNLNGFKERLDHLEQNQPKVVICSHSSKRRKMLIELGPCEICYEPRNEIFAFQPCGHATICEKCTLTILSTAENNNPKCPICRKSVANYSKVYF